MATQAYWKASYKAITNTTKLSWKNASQATMSGISNSYALFIGTTSLKITLKRNKAYPLTSC